MIYKELVDHFGGQQATARALKVKQPSVSAWTTGKCGMSAQVAILTQAKTNGKFKAVDLCPSLRFLVEDVPTIASANSEKNVQVA